MIKLNKSLNMNDSAECIILNVPVPLLFIYVQNRLYYVARSKENGIS